MPGNGARLDSALAFYNDRAGNHGGFAAASMLAASYRPASSLGLVARVGMVNNNPPGASPSGTSITNPLFGGLYSLKLENDFRVAFSLGLTAPIGSGGGNSPDASKAAANAAGVLARSAMDNALFAVNYLTVIPGIDFAWIKGGFTLQAEATLLQLMRTRGEKVDMDSSCTNLTSGAFAGYFFAPWLALETELRYQRWLVNDSLKTAGNPAKQNLSFAVGPRFTFKVDNVTLKPGLAYAQGLVGPIAESGYASATNSDRIVYVDLPIAF